MSVIALTKRNSLEKYGGIELDKMKRVACLIMITVLLMCAALTPALADEDEVVVGSVTQLSGAFMTDAWGINTSDIDVRTLLHGYATVAWISSGEYELDPMVVKSWDIQQDKGDYVTYEYELQPGLKYSDGTDIKAADYCFSLLLLASPEIEQVGAETTEYSALYGYEEYNNRLPVHQGDEQSEVSVLAGVRLLDEYRFSVTVKRSYRPYFYDIVLYRVQPFPMHVIAPGCEVVDDGEGVYLRAAKQADETEWNGQYCVEMLDATVADKEAGYLSHPSVVSGPYMLTSFDWTSREAAFEKNPYYVGNYEGQKPEIEKLRLVCVSNTELVNAVAGGSVDIVNKVTDGQIIDAGEAEVKERRIQSDNYPRSGYGFIEFACEDPAVESVKVRQAIAYALDKDAFCAEFTKGYGEVVRGYYGIGQWMTKQAIQEAIPEFENLRSYAYNMERARTLLREDGWIYDENGEAYDEENGMLRCRKEDDGTITPLVLRWGKTRDNRGSDLLEEMLAPNLEALGIGLEITEVSFSEMLSDYYREHKRQFNMYFLATNFANTFDPYYTYHTGDEYQGVQNTSGLRDEKLMELAWEMRNTPAGDKRTYLGKWVEFQMRWNALLPAIPLYSNTYYDFFSNRIDGYKPSQNWSWACAILYATVK